VFDPCVRRGIAPASGRLAALFKRVGESRHIRVYRNHPLHFLLVESGWSTGWSLSNTTLLWLWGFLKRHQPSSILEFGSGMSTFLLSLYARECAAGGRAVPKITTVEHDPAWVALAEDRLELLDTKRFVTFLLVPLTTDACNKSGHQCYDLQDDVLRGAVGARGADLLLVDGPPGTVGRHEVVPAVHEVLSQRTTVLLDDAYRPGEQEAIRHWQTELSGRLRLLGVLPLGTGLARLYHSDCK
jgi:predicted O-methyltransferase YrrM